jgi:uncharacterized membrane protein (UPF0127 family)
MNAARAAAVSVLIALAGCAQPEATSAEGTLRTERLTIQTANGPVHFNVEVAASEEEQARGLMFRDSLADDRGMLFDFPQPYRAVFWMHNTRIPLDIIYIGVDGRIINIADHTTPFSEDPIPAAGVARAALEIRGGRAEELGIRPGDRVRHRIFPR